MWHSVFGEGCNPVVDFKSAGALVSSRTQAPCRGLIGEERRRVQLLAQIRADEDRVLWLLAPGRTLRHEISEPKYPFKEDLHQRSGWLSALLEESGQSSNYRSITNDCERAPGATSVSTTQS